MAKKFLTNLDLSKNQLLNAAIQNLTTAPINPVKGQLYYNTVDDHMYFFDGTEWIDFSGDIQDVQGGNGLSANTSGSVITLNVNVDGSTIEISGDSLQVKDGGISSTKLANFSTDINNNFGSTAVASAQAVKNYVDGVVGGLGNLEGGWNPSFGSFPIGSDPVMGTKKGDYWYSTATGLIDGVAFNVGDMIIANTADASTSSAADWIKLEVNRDQATEIVLGLIQIASDTDLTDGTDDTKAVTPLKLKTYLDNRTGGYAETIGDGFTTQFFISHGLGTGDVIVAIRETLTGDEVFADVSIAGGSGIYITFATAPASGEYRVVVKK